MLRVPTLLALVSLVLSPTFAAGQEVDARIPAHGELWLEITPTLETWSEQFAEDSPDMTLADGEREPLHADFDGPILDRVFPDPVPELLEGLNADASPLGFQPVDPAGFTVGGLDFGTINVQERRVRLALRFGLLDRLSLEAAAPLSFTEVETSFAFDTAAATVAPAVAALPGAEGFLTELTGSRTELENLLSGGGLSPEEAALAQDLLETSGTFVDALGRRVMENAFLPLAGSAAGGQMSAHYAALAEGFDQLGISVPPLSLQETGSSAALAALFTDAPLSATVPGTTERSWNVGEVEAGLRLGILDTFDDTAATVRLRTSVGGLVRLPLRQAGVPPFQDPDDFLDRPIGDGQRDLELALYQDLRLGRVLDVNASARFGIQMEDELVLRVHPPDRPFPVAETRTLVRRDLGDYVAIRAAPRLRVNEILSVGGEYGFWRKGSDTYELLAGAEAVPSAEPLAVESRERRHRLGVGVFYHPGAGGDGAGSAWQMGFVFQTALSGSGGQTPASQFVLATFRAPMRLFGGRPDDPRSEAAGEEGSGGEGVGGDDGGR